MRVYPHVQIQGTKIDLLKKSALAEELSVVHTRIDGNDFNSWKLLTYCCYLKKEDLVPVSNLTRNQEQIIKFLFNNVIMLSVFVKNKENGCILL